MTDTYLDEILEKLESDSCMDFFQIGEAFETSGDKEHAIIFYKYAKYLCGSSSDKVRISKRISTLRRNPDTDQKALHRKLKLILLRLIQEEKHNIAFNFISGEIIEGKYLPYPCYYLDTDLAILYVFASIGNVEQSFGLPPILSRFTQMHDIRNTYFSLKFLIRRVQFSLPLALQQEIIDYLSSKQISLVATRFLALFMEIHDDALDVLMDKIQELSSSPRIPLSSLIPPQGPVDYDHTFSFIICVNDHSFFSEAVLYLQNLSIPDGYGIEIIPVYGAANIASGYNGAMRRAVGKYKVYLHQDVFVINRNLIYDALRIFELDSSIGMIGIAGSNIVAANGAWWNVPDENAFYCVRMDEILRTSICFTDSQAGDYISAEILDGVLLITSNDLPWREDLIDGWHFYDVSQSFEFNLHGYKTVIPVSAESWAVHDQQYLKGLGESYTSARDKIQAAYPSFFKKPARD